jgi:hypothetical protein
MATKATALSMVGEAEGTDRAYMVMSDGSFRRPGRFEEKAARRLRKREAHRNRVPRKAR